MNPNDVLVNLLGRGFSFLQRKVRKIIPTRFPFWVLYAGLAVLLVVLLHPSDFVGVGWEHLRPHLVAVIAEILFTVGAVDVYLRLRERAEWKGVERLVRERLLGAMHRSTAMMEEAVALEDDSSEWLSDGQGDDLLPLAEHHVDRTRKYLIARVGDLGMPQARWLYNAMVLNLQDFSDSLDSIMGHYSQRLNPKEMELLFSAHRQAGYLRNQLLLCLSLEKDGTEQAKETFDATVKRIPQWALRFLQSLIAAEEACAEKYRVAVSTH